MPKQVDHAARREELARALWRVIVHKGVEGASVRAVAQEAGWSAGALRYYFATQDELLRFGVELQLQRIPARLQTIAAQQPQGLARAVAVLEQLLPLDEERIAEARVWFAVLARAQVDAALDDVRHQGWSGEAYLARGALCDLLDRPWPKRIDDPLEPELEAEAEALRVFVDGLCLLGVNHPEDLPAERIRELLARQVRAVSARLDGATAAH